MSKKRKPSEEEIGIFQNAVKGTKPLVQKKIRLAPPASPLKPLKPGKNRLHWDDLPIERETQATAIVKGEESISYKQSGVSSSLLSKLSKSQFPIDAILDLHGLSIEKALLAVDDFFQQCRHNSVRVALIIHGKGQHSETPVLKNEINHLLRTLNIVLAFCSASPKHGGRGAIYVLLKTEES